MPVRRTIKTIYKSIPSSNKWDWSLLSLCLFISSMIWLFQSLNKTNYNTTIEFPIDIKFLREDVIALEPPPQSIDVKISGSGWGLLQKTLGIGVSSLQIEIEDPTKVRFFTAKSLMPDIVQQLSDVRVDFIEEDSIFLRYDTLAVKEIVLFVDSSKINISDNYRIASTIKLDPSRFTVEGAASLVKSQPDSLEIKLERTFEESYKELLKIPFEPPRQITFYPEGVSVEFEVDMYFKKTTTLPVRAINFPADSSVHLARSMAIVEYYVRRANEMQPISDSLEILADYELRDKSDSTILPRFNSPFFMEDVMILPSKLKLIYEKNRKKR